YLHNAVTSGKWLQVTQNGTGILRAYCLLKGFNLVFWDLAETPGEFDITSKLQMLGLPDRHLVRTMSDGVKKFIALKRMENDQ
ncbi:MAG: hypothetical protein JNJ47_04875, partial [Alphaproteobacteria bacterium]|nr:hypothetical protein [Alphaproteobacteria bacterium]